MTSTGVSASKPTLAPVAPPPVSAPSVVDSSQFDTPPVAPSTPPAVAPAAALLTPPYTGAASPVQQIVEVLQPVHMGVNALLATVLARYAFDPDLLQTFRADAEASVRAWDLPKRAASFISKVATPAQLQDVVASIPSVQALRPKLEAILSAVNLPWSLPAAGSAPADPNDAEATLLQRLCPNQWNQWQASPAMRNYLRELVQTQLPGEALAAANAWLESPAFVTLLQIETSVGSAIAAMPELPAVAETLAKRAAPLELEQCDAVLAQAPRDVQARRIRADLAGKVLQQYPQAIDDLTAVMGEAPNADDYIERAHLYELLGDKPAAEADLARASVFELSSDEIFHGFLLLARDNALTALPEKTQPVLPAQWGALVRRGLTYAATRQWDKARRDLATAQGLSAPDGAAQADLDKLAKVVAQYAQPAVSMPPPARIDVPQGEVAGAVAARLAQGLDVLTPLCDRMDEYLRTEFALLPGVSSPAQAELLQRRDEFNTRVADLLVQLCTAEQLSEMEAVLAGPSGALVLRALPLVTRVSEALHRWLKSVGSEVADVYVGPDLRGTPLRDFLAVLDPDAASQAGGVYGAQCDHVAQQVRAMFAPEELQVLLSLAQTAAMQRLFIVYRRLNTEFFRLLQNGSLQQTAIALATAQLAQAESQLQTNPDDVDALAARRMARFHTHDEAGAADDMDRILALAPTANNYRWRSMLHFANKRYDAALADADQAVALAPRDALAFIVRAHAHWGLGAHEEACLDAGQACSLAVDPTELLTAQQVLATANDALIAAANGKGA